MSRWDKCIRRRPASGEEGERKQEFIRHVCCDDIELDCLYLLVVRQAVKT